jgi:hypothetical protein
MHHTSLGEVVERCLVGAEPVVPESHVAELPAPTDRELRLGEMREEEGEQRVALFLRQFEDATRKTRIDKEPSPAVLNGAHDSMDDGGLAETAFSHFSLRAPMPQRLRGNPVSKLCSAVSPSSSARSGGESAS